MATREEAAEAKIMGNKYRSFLYGEGEKSTEWRHGGPPSFDKVDKLFEEGKTKVRVDGWMDGPQSSSFLISLSIDCCSQFAGMAKRVTGRNSTKCFEVMGYGVLTQDPLEGLQVHKP
jgi:hypothetical protein